MVFGIVVMIAMTAPLVLGIYGDDVVVVEDTGDETEEETPETGEDIDGTDAAETLEGTEAGETIRGLAGDDNILGRQGADTIEGGAGDDTLYSTGLPGTVSDDAIDTLLGGDGDDLLRLAGGDIGDGGAGNDTYQVAEDAEGNTTLRSFVEEEDAIIVEYPSGSDAVTITSQAAVDGNLLVTLSNGNTITIEGRTAPVDEANFTFLERV